MIVEALIAYIFDKKFIYQSLATLTTYVGLKLARFYIVRHRRYQLFKYYGIPGPKPNLYNGNLSEYTGKNAHFEVDKRFRQKYGEIFGTFIGDEPSVIITNVDMLKKIFLEEGKAFTERSNVFISTPIVQGILFAKYPRWKLMRKVMSPYFSSFTIRGDSSNQFIEHSIKLMQDYIDRKLEEARASNTKLIMDIQGLMKSTALHLISEMAVRLPNVQVTENDANVVSLDTYLAMSDKGVVLLAIAFPFLRSIFQFLANYTERNRTLTLIHRNLNKLIDDKLNEFTEDTDEKEHRHVIELLIKLHHEGKLTREEVIGNAEALLFAGYDTTSTTLAYTFWVLAKHSKYQEQLRTELKAHGTSSKYLEQVINETMRLYPTVVSFTTRLATESVRINDLTIPQGTRVAYNAMLMQHNSSIWPNPEQFDPNRFREGVEIHPLAFAPFGLGEKKCLGYQLAMLEMKMIVCDILLRYRVKLISPNDLELVSYATIMTKPKEKIMVELEKL